MTMGRRPRIVIGLFAIVGFPLMSYAMQQQGPPPSVFQATLEQNYPNIAKAMNVVASRTPGGASMPKTAWFACELRIWSISMANLFRCL